MGTLLLPVGPAKQAWIVVKSFTAQTGMVGSSHPLCQVLKLVGLFVCFLAEGIEEAGACNCL